MPDDHFGEDVAAHYDETLGEMAEPAAVARTVAFLAEEARGGPALEFGVGTGRIALPLSAAGVDVHGIDLSTAMLARLRAKPSAQRVGVTQGDFATARAGRLFTLAYLVFNTIGNLTTQEQQVDCFGNAAAHLEPGGRFVIEVGVPQLQRLPPGETHRVFAATPTHFGVDEYDLVEQGLVSHHYHREGEAWRYEAVPLRYVWPAELDLMARLAGLRRVARYADWDRTPFTADSTKHVSVWEKAPSMVSPEAGAV
ncbi:MAG TPA: class I SAM-dependent methyltransferase [Jatrophihabitans sp.]|nr:class I SAM-dependent methyltransferase [Jatrophihabitans sp.]